MAVVPTHPANEKTKACGEVLFLVNPGAIASSKGYIVGTASLG